MAPVTRALYRTEAFPDWRKGFSAAALVPEDRTDLKSLSSRAINQRPKSLIPLGANEGCTIAPNDDVC